MIWLLALLRFLFLDTAPGGSDADDTDDDGDGSGNGDSSGDGDSHDDEPVRDRKAKLASLKEANARLARKAKKLQARVEELERGNSNGGAALRAAQLESAFLRAVMNSEQRIADLEDAWDLCQAKGFLDVVKIDEADQVVGMADAIAKLLARYPWLIDEAEDEPPERPAPIGPKIRPPIRDKEARPLPNRKSLEKRMPALRRGRR